MPITTYTIEKEYGLENVTDAQLRHMAHTLLIVVGADGAIPDEEFDALRDIVRRKGGSDSLLDELNSFDWSTAQLEDHVPGDLSTAWKRILLYDAIRIACADGVYEKRERAAARKTAALLALDTQDVAMVEDIIDAELSIQARRVAFFHGT